jgi:hypothetical protein
VIWLPIRRPRAHDRSNATHASSTHPEALLYRKGGGKEAKLSFMGHALMETAAVSSSRQP